MVPVPAQITVTVDRTPVPLSAPVLVDAGRVLLPARSVFEALGAEVRYDAAQRRVVVSRSDRDVVITLGAQSALVDGHDVALGVPARVERGRTYLPLRFVAESLGAGVTYDASSHTIAVTTNQARTAHGPPTVEQRRPSPGETVTGAFPSISAALETHGGPPIDDSTVRLFIDGRDVTDQLYRQGDLIGYTPAQQILAGSHEITLQGADTGGTRFTSNWPFYSTFAYSTVPAPNNYGGFYLNGPSAYMLPGFVQLVLIAPGGGYGYANLCGYGQQSPFVYAPTANRYIATVPVPVNLFAPSCLVSGYFFDASGTRNYIALATPISINTMPSTLSATHTPAPKPTLRVIHPTPVPSPTASPKPPPRRVATPHPTPSPHATRKPATPRPATPRPLPSG